MANKLRSRAWFERNDIYGFIYRSWIQNRGVPQDQFDGRPVIGICNTYSELTPAIRTFAPWPSKSATGCWKRAASRWSSR